MWRKIQKFLETVVPFLLISGYVLIAVCLLNRWDPVVPLTLVPVWIWAAAGAVISLLSWIACRGFKLGMVFCVFLATAVGFSEETHGILREAIASFEKDGEGKDFPPADLLRIVTVDCGGRESSLRKAADAVPDVLLVRGAPDPIHLENVADQLFGVERSVTLRGTLAILGRGKTLAVQGDGQGRALHVRLKHTSGVVLDITNLDLSGCSPRPDFWKPVVWRELVGARVETRRLVRNHLGEHPLNRALVARIVGGGFGTPPGDDVFRPLQNAGMLDTFAWSGMGFGNTWPSRYPFLRLDQIWISPNLVPGRSVTRLNHDSDHRIVVSEVRAPRSKVKQDAP
ncbi:MAG: hypothetical protein KGR69_02635 [Verrucomicrobia bacterium]|nr:hypothetical protein [Verrucomicrobiota bacterium]